MEHLDFIKELDKLGINIQSTNIENKPKVYNISTITDISFNTKNEVEIKNLEISYVDKLKRNQHNAFKDFLISCIDIKKQKYSQYININDFDAITEILQNKIIKKAKEIEKLLTLIFILNKNK